MNILSQLERVLDSQERGIARVIGQRGGGKVVAETESGAVLILTGELESHKQCYYDRRSNKILGEAPDIPYSEYGV